MSDNVNFDDLLKPVKLTKEKKEAYRIDGDPADFDDAFLESLETAAKNLKEKELPKDTFEK